MSSAEQKKAINAEIAKDQEKVEAIQQNAEEVLEGMQIFKTLDKMHEQAGGNTRFQNIKYVEREENQYLVDK